jgi:hypothetical protein
MYEVLTRWSGSNAADSMVTVMNFTDAVPISDIRGTLADFWTTVSNQLSASTTWSIDESGREFDAASGQTTGLWSDPAAKSGAGSVTGDGPVSNASMMLLQWRTGLYRNGRELRGRSFIPGLAVNRLTGGEVSNATRAAIQTSLNSNIIANGYLEIWSRPKGGSPGTSATVVAGTIWNEMAVLRGRRG